MNLIEPDSLSDSLRDRVGLKKVVAGQRLFRQGDRATKLFTIKFGNFQEIRHTNESQTATIQMLTTGSILGEASLFSDTYLSTAIAQVDAEVIVYPQPVLLSAIADNNIILENLIRLLCQKIHQLQIRIELRDIKASVQRILQYLKYNTSANNSQVVQLNFALQEIAAELGFTPETISRALTKLEQEGIIIRSSNKVILLNLSSTNQKTRNYELLTPNY